MNTRQINDENTPKAGKDNTKVVLTAAGAVAVGAATGVAGSVLFGDDGNPLNPEEQKEEQGEEQAQNEQQNDADNGQQQNVAQAQQSVQTHQQPQSTGVTHPAGGGAAGATGTTGTTDTPDTPLGGGGTSAGDHPSGDEVETEALAVAERLVETDEIDVHDIDDLAITTFEESDILYMENGNEIPVAAVSTPDGGQYLLADVNGDKIYDVVYDTNGEIVTAVQSGLNTNDAQLALDEDGGYLPITDDDPDFKEEDVDVDIVALDDSNDDDDELIAVSEESNDDLIAVSDDDDTMDDLFAEEDAFDEEEDALVDSAMDLEIDEDSDLDEDLIDA